MSKEGFAPAVRRISAPLLRASLLPRIACLGLGVALVATTVGCATSTRSMQMRMAGPLVTSGDSGTAPVMYFEKIYGFEKDEARFVEGSPANPLANRVNLRPNAKYAVTLVLPDDYEQRRLSMLETKEQQLLNAIGVGEQRLRENTEKEARLLSHSARASLIQNAADMRVQLDQTRMMSSSDGAARRISADQLSNASASSLQRTEEILRQDDMVRDTLLPQPVVEQLTDRLRAMRADLAEVQSQMLAINLMTANPTSPYPRVMGGVVETYKPSTFTRAGAIPLEISDEYLDWIREGKVVTIVSFDPNEIPADDEAAAYRTLIPEQWPQNNLMVIERAPVVAGVPRLAAGGTGPNAQIVEMRYPGSVARTYSDPAGNMWTYVTSSDGTRVWVFGPDVTPPANVEVWAGSTPDAIKLYPPNERTSPEMAYVRQIAGVEGGVLDPIREAEKRGRVLAITRLGNLQRGDADDKWLATNAGMAR